MELKYIFILITLLGINTSILYKKDKNKNKYYTKIHDLLYEKSSLDKDPYHRQLGKKTVKEFSKIAKHSGIKLDDIITDEMFDKIYLDYVKYQIKKYNSIL
jgi:hypothetical protein